MDPRLQIAPAVAAIVDDPTLADAVAKREHTELRCVSCGQAIPPELDAPASLLLVRAADAGDRQRYLVCFAHAACADSQVVDAPGALAPAETPVTWTPVLREDVVPRAVLLLELHDYVAGAPLPALDGASVAVEPGALIVSVPGNDPLRLDEAGAVFPPGWHEVARAEAALLLLAGTGMGLDRPDAERIDRAMQMGRVAGVEVPVR